MIPTKIKESLKSRNVEHRPYLQVAFTGPVKSEVAEDSNLAPDCETQRTGRDSGESQHVSDTQTSNNHKPLPRIGSAVLVVDGDRLLLGVRGKDPNRGKWVLPGGGVHPFESIAEAARRELLEETGLDIEVDNQVDILEIIEPPAEHRVIVFSQAHAIGGQMRASSDLQDVRFCARGEITNMDLSDAVRPVLKKLGWA